MLSFAIKKTFFDMWDNLLHIMIINTGLLLLAILFVMIPQWLLFPDVALIIYLILGIMAYTIFTGAIARFTMDISNYEQAGFRDFFRYIKETWKLSLGFPLAINLSVALIIFVLLFYFISNSIIYWILGGVVFWTWITVLLSSLYFFPVAMRLKKKPVKSMKTSFILFFDNTGFTVLMFLGLVVILLLSVFLLTLLPGLATMMLWINVCFKLRLYKYDYLEEHPDANRKKIPWFELLMTDEKKVGKRTLRGMIFPWKQ